MPVEILCDNWSHSTKATRKAPEKTCFAAFLCSSMGDMGAIYPTIKAQIWDKV
jgi:hypothetical protein